MSLSPSRPRATAAFAAAAAILAAAPSAHAAPVALSPQPVCSIGGLGRYPLAVSFDVAAPASPVVQGQSTGALPFSVSFTDSGALSEAGAVTVEGTGRAVLTARVPRDPDPAVDTFPATFAVASQPITVPGASQPSTITGRGTGVETGPEGDPVLILVSAFGGNLALSTGGVSFNLVARDENGTPVLLPQGAADSDGDPTTFDVVCVPAVGGADTTISTVPILEATPPTSPRSPDPAGRPAVTNVRDTTASMRWSEPPRSLLYPTTNYQVVLDDRVVGTTLLAGKSSWNLTGLTPGTTYTVRTNALNVSAFAVPSGSTTFTTTGTSPTVTPGPTPTPPVGTPTPGPTPTPPVSTPTPGPTPTPPFGFPATYGFDIAGTSTVKNLVKGTLPVTGSVLLGLGLDSGALSGDLKLNGSQANLTALGILPVSATVNLISTEKVTGLLLPSGAVTATAKVRIKLPSIKTFGIQLAGGANCQATQVSTIPLTGTLSPLRGGTIAGTFSISNLSGCGVLNGIVSPLTAGAGNSIALKLTPNGQGAQ